MVRSRRRQKATRGPYATQVKEVQGPVLNGRPPETARVRLDSNLEEKYLGRGLLGLGPTLEVLNNAAVDQLLRQHGYELYRRMLTDAEVDASLDTILQSACGQPLRATSPLRVDDPDYAVSQELADFVNYVFDCLNVDEWRREQARSMLVFGNACSEIDWDLEETGPWANHMVIDRLRLQRPEDYGYIVDRYGTNYGVAPLGQAQGVLFPMGNLIPLDDSMVSTLLKGAVPLYKLSVWTWEMRGTDPRGTSALIPAFVPWWSKQRALEEWACWLGRYAQPSLWGTPGPDAVPTCVTLGDGSQVVTQPTESLLQAMLQFKSASVLALPFGSEINKLDMSGGVGPFLESIRAFDTQITRAITGQHLATNEGEKQSRSAAEVHATVLRQLINSLRRFIAKRIRDDVIRPMIEINYGDVGRLMPEVDMGDGDGWPPTVTEVAVLFQSGFFSEDQLPKLDKILGLPVRETNNRVGPGNLPAAPLEPTPDGTNPSASPRESRPAGQY